MDFNNFAKAFRKARLIAGIRQDELASLIGSSRDLVVRIERGENVGIHFVLSACSIMGMDVSLVQKLPSNAQVISGSFDDFYKEKFRNNLVSDLLKNPDRENGLFKKQDSNKKSNNMRILNWNQASKI